MAKTAKKQAKKAAKRAVKKAAKQSKEQLVIAVLSRARELLSKGWTRKVAARDAANVAVYAASFTACKFCAYGAIKRSVLDLTGAENFETEDAVITALGFEVCDGLFHFNDGAKSKKAVLGLFGSAIQRLEA
jgi:hypothetical protein